MDKLQTPMLPMSEVKQLVASHERLTERLDWYRRAVKFANVNTGCHLCLEKYTYSGDAGFTTGMGYLGTLDAGELQALIEYDEQQCKDICKRLNVVYTPTEYLDK